MTASSTQRAKAIRSFSIGAGLALVPMLPLGMYDGVARPAFLGFFLLHLILLGGALFTTLIFLAELVRRSNSFGLLAAAVMLVCAAAAGVEALHPVIARDALIHHLAVPKWWVERGFIAPIFWHDWSFYPMLLNLSFTGLIQLHADWAAPFVHGAYLVLLAGVSAGAVLSLRSESAAALFAAAAAFLTPVCLTLSSEPLVDLGLALFAAISVCEVLAWAEARGDDIIPALRAGAAAGLALSTKYNGFLFLAVLGGATLALAGRKRLRPGRIILGGFVIAAVAVIVFAPWALRNLLAVGNPVYPLARGLFGPPSDQSLIGGLSPLAQRRLLYGESWAMIALLPFRMLFAGEDGNPRLFDGALTPLLLLGFVPFLRRKFRDEEFFLFLLAAGYWLLALVTAGARVRYLSPVYGPLFMLAASGAFVLRERMTHRRGALYPAMILAAALFAVPHVLSMLKRSDALLWAGGMLTRDQYLMRHIAEYPLITYVNENVRANERVYLVLTGNEFYYYRAPVISGGHYSAGPLLSWIHSSSDAQDLYSGIRETMNISYLLVHERRLEEMLSSLDAADNARWREFRAKHLVQRYEARGYSLLQLAASAPEPAS